MSKVPSLEQENQPERIKKFIRTISVLESFFNLQFCNITIWQKAIDTLMQTSLWKIELTLGFEDLIIKTRYEN